MQRFINATIACLVIVGFVVGGEYVGLVTSVSKDEVKITVKKDKKDKTGEEKVFKAKELKITKGKDGEASIDDVAKMIADSKGKTKGVFGKLVTEGEGDKEVAVKLSVGGGKKKDK